MWDGHSCPSPLTLVLVLLVFSHKCWAQAQPHAKVKSDGQECPSHIGTYGAQSPMKMFVSCGALALRFDAHTSFLPSGENMGKPSKPSL
jgi:hypothetical protein